MIFSLLLLLVFFFLGRLLPLPLHSLSLTRSYMTKTRERNYSSSSREWKWLHKSGEEKKIEAHTIFGKSGKHITIHYLSLIELLWLMALSFCVRVMEHLPFHTHIILMAPLLVMVPSVTVDLLIFALPTATTTTTTTANFFFLSFAINSLHCCGGPCPCDEIFRWIYVTV